MVRRGRVQRTLVVEGGGDENTALVAEMRAAFKALQDRALSGLPNFHVVVGQGRRETYDTFCEELEAAGPGDSVILLVDAEEVVTAASRWAHVGTREGDKWRRPPQATDDHLHFMAVVMETWLVADPAALNKVFGKRFDASKLPNRPDLEQVSKPQVYEALDKATGGGRDAYGKGKHSFQTLKHVDPAILEAKLPSAKAFFDALRRQP